MPLPEGEDEEQRRLLPGQDVRLRGGMGEAMRVDVVVLVVVALMRDHEWDEGVALEFILLHRC